jgi:hypothetical protein
MLPYTANYNKLPAFFSSLYTNAVPKKVTYRFIVSLGFKSSKERDLYTFLHAFGFIGASGVPTSWYTEFKQATSPEMFVSSCAKSVYSELLTTSADFLDPSQLSTLVQRIHKEASSTQQDLICHTFIALNTYASFIPVVKETSSTEKATKRPINININLPETDNEAVYGVIFKYLKDILGG